MTTPDKSSAAPKGTGCEICHHTGLLLKAAGPMFREYVPEPCPCCYTKPSAISGLTLSQNTPPGAAEGKRYSMDYTTKNYGHSINVVADESDTGEWVKYEDHARLADELSASLRERDEWKALLSSVSESLAHLIHCASHFASEDRAAPIEANNLHYAVDDAEGDLSRIDAALTRTSHNALQ
jgi:hypothetical protein